MLMQFHCLPAEITGFIKRASTGLNLHFVLLGWPPFTAKEVSFEDLEAEVIRAGQSTFPMSLNILLDPPHLPVASGMAFYDAHPDNIVVDIGTLSDSALVQSAVSTKTTNAVLKNLVKKIAKEVKAITHAGVTAVNVEMGVKSLDKSFRYTDAAQELEHKGVNMLPIAGGIKLVLGNVVD